MAIVYFSFKITITQELEQFFSGSMKFKITKT